MRLLRVLETDNSLLISMVGLVLLSRCVKQSDSLITFGIDSGLPKKEVILLFQLFCWANCCRYVTQTG